MAQRQIAGGLRWPRRSLSKPASPTRRAARRHRLYPACVTVLIDPPRWPAHGRVWSHLVSDASHAELHAFARANGVPERGFDHDHYDVPLERRETIIALGAQPVTGRELLSRLQRSGLRVTQAQKKQLAEQRRTTRRPPSA